MNRSRLPIVLVLIVAITAAGFARHWAMRERSIGKGAVQNVGSARLSSLNSFALTLLLGGLRGPLVMFLWPSAETQKQDKNLDDLDTKIELIRLLQAEFDTVHIFQIWNKAYNISVQMANLGNKYRTILDALDYAHRTDAERPNDINILAAIGQVYFDKLANSAEKVYYRQRVRDESLPRQDVIRIRFPAGRANDVLQAAVNAGLPPRRVNIVNGNGGLSTVLLPKQAADAVHAKLGEDGVTYTDRPTQKVSRDSTGRGELEPMLDEQFNILPGLVTPKESQSASVSTEEFNDGSELQYLQAFQPYPYGVSPWALGYNYWKRAEVLQSVYGQKHAQLSDSVIDSRPGLALKFWAEEDWERGREAEGDAFGKVMPTSTETGALEATTAAVSLDTPLVHPAALKEAIFEYARGVELTVAALAEYRRHLAKDPSNLSTYLSHVDELNAENELMQADHDYLLALSEPSQRTTAVAAAAKHYQEAILRYELILLQYTTTEQLAQQIFPKGLDRATIAKADLPAATVDALLDAVVRALPPKIEQYENGDDFRSYMTYVLRARERLSLLPKPTTQPQ